VNVSAAPKVRVNLDEFLARSQRQPQDVDSKLMDAFTVAVRHCLILFSKRRAIVHRERNALGKTESAIVRDGETDLDPPGISVSVAALLGF
jgi:hypothetical protein